MLVVGGLTLAGCDRAPAVDEPPKLTAVRRLVDAGMLAGADPRLERGTHVFLASDARPVLSAARAFEPGFRCEPLAPASQRRCAATVPHAMPAAPFTILDLARGLAKHQAPRPKAAATGGTAVPPAPRQPTGDPERSVVLRGDGQPSDAGNPNGIQVLLARAYPAPALAERALESAPFTVPPDALLRLSIGVEEPAWWVDSAPVYFRVVVVGDAGNVQDLFRRVLDPARRPGDRRWFDSDVDLSDLAGSTIRLRFVTEPAESGDTRPSLPLWGDPRVLAPPAPARRPSIVLVSLDTLRAMSMSTYGYALETSPNFSTLAARGALFEHAFTTYSNTLPAHMSMLTGLYPATHGVFDPPQVLGAEHATLAELLRDAGYATAAFTEDALLDTRRGFWRGFSAYYENTQISIGAGDAAGTFGRALEWAGRHTDEPFFLFAHTYQVHSPYEPAEAYRELFTGPEGVDLGQERRAYEQEIRQLDDILQRFVDGLRTVLPDRELLLVVTADHGEEFYGHGLVKHNQLYRQVMDVPLVMVWAGHIAAGLRIAPPVSLVDLTPTILGLAGVPAPAGLDGVSLVPLLTGRASTLDRAAVFGEYPQSWGVREPHYVARSANAKCFLKASGQGDFCFDLTRDPDEREPRPPQGTVAFSSLHALGDAYRTRSLEVRRRVEDATKRGKPDPSAAVPDSPTADAGAGHDPAEHADPVERKMRALGYIE